ncbi:MAG: AMP-binding protein [Clostridiales bacterium]|nr:AMP-binding protein [Clostridiales bacterium]
MGAEMVYDVPDIRSFREMMENSAEKYGERTAFIFWGGDHQAESVTYKEFYAQIKALASYLNSRGFGGRHIGVIGRNCYDWALTYLAVSCGVGVIVPIDKELKAPDIAYIADDAGLDLIVAHDDALDTVRQLDGLVRKMPEIIPMSGLKEAVEAGEKLIAGGDRSYEEHKVDYDDMSIILYTSGTTGSSKGVMLSQRNICYDIVAICKRFILRPEDRVLSILPLHHTFECTTGFLTPIYAGASIAYNDSLRRIMNDFAVFRPSYLVAVPLLLENVHSNILKKIKKSMVGAVSFRLGKSASKLSPTVGRLVFSQIQEAFGGRLTTIISGAAALAPEIFNDLTAFGFKVHIGYGLTEASPVVMMQNDFKPRHCDDVGSALHGVQVRLISETTGLDVPQGEVGEIAVKGPNIMLGYYNNPEATAKVMRDGWFYTGDLAILNERGDYQIVGRNKNVIVTKNGKKIFPEEMEALLEKNRFVKEAIVYGSDDDEGDSVVSAKIYPDFAEVNAYLSGGKLCPKEDIDAAAETGVFSDGYKSALTDIFKNVVKEVNRGVPQYRYIHKFKLRKTEFVKTTTKKIKRNAEESETDYLI